MTCLREPDHVRPRHIRVRLYIDTADCNCDGCPDLVCVGAHGSNHSGKIWMKIGGSCGNTANNHTEDECLEAFAGIPCGVTALELCLDDVSQAKPQATCVTGGVT